ncbi:MAG TPA: uroporphyrinogen decarboxylase family protein [Armatimonadota bacterium]|jgi:hypothetical protein
MDNRERYLATFRFEPVDHPPLLLGGPWPETLRRWESEGMPAGVTDLHEYFGIEPFGMVNASPQTRLYPGWEFEILEEDDTYVTMRTHNGAVVRRRIEMRDAGAEHYLSYPVHGPEDMEWLAERFDPSNPGREDNNWRERLEQGVRDHAVNLMDFGSFFGDLHEHMGTAAVAMAFYDMPDFVHWYNDKIATLVEVAEDKTLPLGLTDSMGGHEDMAYKGAPLISPAMFREFMMPYYRRTVGKAQSYGQWLFMQDCDGDFRLLLPLWLEVGVNGMSPCEVAAGIDVGELRAEYGRDVLLSGGIDKRVLAVGGEKMKQELESRYATAELGGYVPGIDHGVPPDVSWANYCEYVAISKRLCGIA